MSVDVASLPAWKLALLERKRRQEIDSHGIGSQSDGSEKLGNIPPWKQEILFRKQQKRHSTGRTYGGLDGENRRSLSEILLSPEDGERFSHGIDPWPVLLSPVRDAAYYGDLKTTCHLSNSAVDHASELELDGAPVDERLPPVHQNPILLFDLEKRQHSGFQVSLSSPAAGDSHQRSSLPSKLSKLQVNSHESLDGEHIQCPAEEAQDDVFRGEEVTYGKGFVSRLLQRFSYLSVREDQSIPPPPFLRSLSRGQSSEDFTKHHYAPDVGSKKNAARKKTNSVDDLLVESMSSRSVVENGAMMNGGDDREGSRDLSSAHEGQTEVSIVLNAKSIFESLATSPTSIKNPAFQDRHSTSVKKIHETQEAQRSAENHNEPNRKEARDNTIAPSGPTVVQSNSSSTAHQPPVIIGPKPVYTGHLTSLKPAEHQLTKCPNAQKSGDINFVKDTAEKTKNSAQISIMANRVAPNQAHKTGTDHKNMGSISESQSLLVSNEATNPPHDSKDHASHLYISPHIQEPSKIKEHVPASLISVPSQKDRSAASNMKTHEPSLKENATVPKKPPPSRPGLLLIRPASNLTTTKTEYLQMTKYNDITRGEFAPAKRPIRKTGGDDDEDSDADDVDGARDCSKYLKVRYEFEGGGIQIGRSLLAKTKKGIQVRIHLLILLILIITKLLLVLLLLVCYCYC